MATKRVFLSFIAEDRKQVDGLRLLAANPDYDLEFYDESVRTPFDSKDSEYVRRRIREKISRTTVTVCLIGENTHKSAWVDWEMEESAVGQVDRLVTAKSVEIVGEIAGGRTWLRSEPARGLTRTPRSSAFAISM